MSAQLTVSHSNKAQLTEQLSFTPAQVQLIRDTVAKGATENEFLLFMHLAQHYGLDPFLKEIWCIKYVPTGRNPADYVATIFTSRDGYLKIASRTPEMDGIQSDVVYEHDTLEKLPDGRVHHQYGNPRGAIVGAYALVHRKDRSLPAYFFAPLSEYNGGGNPTWKKYPSAMIVKVAEAMALKRAFSISGLVTQEELGLEVEPAEELATGAVVLSEPQAETPAKPAAGSGAGATASTSPAPSTTSGPSDEAVLAGHRTRLLYARTIGEVQQIWGEIPGRLKPELVPDKDAAKARLSKAVSKPAPSNDLVAEFVEKPALGVGGLASQGQKQEIQRLLNMPVITSKEKADLLLVLGLLDNPRANQVIFKLRNVLAEREGRDADKETRQALHAFVHRYTEQLGGGEVARLADLVEDRGLHWQVLYDELAQASANLKAAAQAVAA